MTNEEMRQRYDALVDLAETRDVPLDHVDIPDPFAWVAFVEELLTVRPDSPVPTR